MKKGGVEVLKREREDEEGGVRKRRRVEEEEDKCGGSDSGVSELRAAIEELSSVAADGTGVISTVGFLTVSNLLLLVLDKVGPTMAVLRRDVQSNIERLEDFYVLNPPVYSNLVKILKEEVEEGSAKKQESCSRAVVWLTRSMDFGVALLEALEKDEDVSLEDAVEAAYVGTMKPWHGWIASTAYKVAVKLIPDRKSFTNLLMSQGEDHSMLKRDIEVLLSLLLPFLKEIHNHLELFQLDKLRSK